MYIMNSTKFAIQQLLQSILTLTVLGGKEDIKILEQIIEKQKIQDEDNQVIPRSFALVPIIQELIKDINKHS